MIELENFKIIRNAYLMAKENLIKATYSAQMELGGKNVSSEMGQHRSYVCKIFARDNIQDEVLISIAESVLAIRGRIRNNL